MKIAHVITRMILGGAQQNTLDSVRGLEAMGRYDVTLIAGPQLGPEGSLLAMEGGSGPKIIYIPSLCREVSPGRDALAFWQLYRLFRREKFDLVHTHSSKAGILGRLAARKAGVPRIVHTVHGFALGPYQTVLLNHFYAGLERFAGRRTDVLICVSESLMKEAEKWNLKPHKMACVPSGFDWDLFKDARSRRARLRQELGFSPGDVVVVKVARFFPLKGHQELFDVMETLLIRFGQLKFLLVGGGELQSHYAGLVASRRWGKRVLFTGLVPPAKVPDLLAASDILVHTSLREGLARVIPQAFACWLPVVSFDVDGASDLVKDSVTGFLVPPADKSGLTEAIGHLVADEGLRQAMGTRGHDLAAKRYQVSSMVRALDQIYRGI